MDRRTFLKRLGAAGAGIALGTPLVAPRARAQAPDLGRMAYQLGWIKNFQFAGDYVADYRKYYARFGVAVDLVSGGPTVSVEPSIVSGKTLVGQSMPDDIANAVNKGAPLRIIASLYQRNVSAIVSLAKTPLVTPSDMIGRRIGVQVNNGTLWHAFLRFNKISPSSITTVPVQYDLSPLVTGEVDGFFGEVIDDAVEMRTKGYPVHSMLFADFGYNMLTATYAVTTDTLRDRAKRAQVVAFMKGDILGWRDAVKDPDMAAHLTVDVYGKGNGLDFERQKASCVTTNDYIVSDDTHKHGLFCMTPKSIDETLMSLAGAGVRAGPELFTTEILDEANEGLKGV
jgi:ABC-type nitrate/sulfonate/bicarbonate transport system substrate-binding protein